MHLNFKPTRAVLGHSLQISRPTPPVHPVDPLTSVPRFMPYFTNTPEHYPEEVIELVDPTLQSGLLILIESRRLRTRTNSTRRRPHTVGRRLNICNKAVSRLTLPSHAILASLIVPELELG